MRAFHERFRQACAESQISTRLLATTLGVSKSHVARVLAGSRPPPADLVERMAEALCVPAAERPRWQLLAALSRCPLGVEQALLDLEREVADLRAQLDALRAAPPGPPPGPADPPRSPRAGPGQPGRTEG